MDADFWELKMAHAPCFLLIINTLWFSLGLPNIFSQVSPVAPPPQVSRYDLRAADSGTSVGCKLKGQFTQKWKINHYLLDTMKIESVFIKKLVLYKPVVSVFLLVIDLQVKQLAVELIQQIVSWSFPSKHTDLFG